jgi:hypothetical protein
MPIGTVGDHKRLWLPPASPKALAASAPQHEKYIDRHHRGPETCRDDDSKDDPSAPAQNSEDDCRYRGNQEQGKQEQGE